MKITILYHVPCASAGLGMILKGTANPGDHIKPENIIFPPNTVKEGDPFTCFSCGELMPYFNIRKRTLEFPDV